MNHEKSQIKFVVSDTTGELIGFIFRHPKTKKLIGVREDSKYRKKICVLSEHLKGTVVPNVLYNVELKEMHRGQGYVVVEANRMLFKVQFETIIKQNEAYQVNINFGIKTIYFDPVNGKSRLSRTKSGVIEVIASRNDIEDIPLVIEEFSRHADHLIAIMNKHNITYDPDC
ncbi:hypothetical protein IR083_07945 [Dysgonomonas sp. GY75]|uniref:hypothetical protein n=1 Tax=Dysgonomonas sp. GY75 TaxID=2780419 RepID=UPI0018835D2E|nr:hypothetical protein [Dysgonomonas sp. GY75]MBF0648749.1 hypothetical protein [Dysgonomonas sp. GY75]